MDEQRSGTHGSGAANMDVVRNAICGVKKTASLVLRARAGYISQLCQLTHQNCRYNLPLYWFSTAFGVTGWNVAASLIAVGLVSNQTRAQSLVSRERNTMISDLKLTLSPLSHRHGSRRSSQLFSAPLSAHLSLLEWLDLVPPIISASK